MKYAAYDEYKTSNIGWIRDFPAHWELKRLKYVANRAEVKVEADEDNPLPYIGLEQVEPWTGRLVDLDDDLVPTGISNRFEAGDTLFGKLRPYLAKACNVDFDGLCSSELLVLRGKTYDRKFLLYQLLSHGFVNLVDSTTYGSKMPRASWDFIGVCELPLPPLDEQQTIASFLDAKTAQIDALVAQKRQLIAKLKEKRSALIARTVTRGLPPEAAKAAGLEPNPEMKDSGVEWLGKIPEHWQLVSLFRVAQSIQTGPFGTQLHHADYVDDEVPLINPIHLVDGKLQPDSKNTVTPETAERLSRYKLTSGEIVFARRGDIGRCAVVLPEQEGWLCGTGSMVVRLHAQYCDSHYYSLVFQSSGFRSLLELNAVGTTMLNLNPSILGRMLVPVPPLVEQQSIVVFIGNETAKIDSLIQQVESAIARLTEYRQALITSAVTGKIDVRDWQAELEAA